MSIPLWQRAQWTLMSSQDYDNPLQEAELSARFTAPSGRVAHAYGFWDGGRTWKVRFAPDEPGVWRLETCPANPGNSGLVLDETFTCTEAEGDTIFQQHGPIRVSENRLYFEHADGTPFLWLADTARNGSLLATSEDWTSYLETRRRQGFSAVQWVATQWLASPKGDHAGRMAYEGSDQIRLNLDFFRALEAKHDALTVAGLLSVPVMLWAANWNAEATLNNPGATLPENQAILLARYMLARWGADPVTWCLPGDGPYQGEQAERWQRIGRAVFGEVNHAPVTLHPSGQQWIGNFKREPWLDYLGYQSGHGDGDTYARWLLEGPPARQWQDTPLHPVINLEPPYENHVAYQSRMPFSGHATRKRLYWSLFVHPTAGVTYGGHGVWGWDDGSGPPTAHPDSGTPLPWQQALMMPAAEQVQYLRAALEQLQWWQLRPVPELLAEQPARGKSDHYLVAACNEVGDEAVVYAPENTVVKLRASRLASGLEAHWLEPSTGRYQKAMCNMEDDIMEDDIFVYQVPAGEDWLLLLKRKSAL